MKKLVSCYILRYRKVYRSYLNKILRPFGLGDQENRLSYQRKAIFLIFLAVLNISGCTPLLIGVVAGGVGVYAVSKDTIQGDSDTSYEALWDAAVTVARIRGTIKQEDFNRGYIEIEAKPNKIWISFFRLTTATTRIKVSARKYKLPNVDLAQDVFLKIIEEAKRVTIKKQ